MADLSVKYLGLDLANPVIIGSSPLTSNIDNLVKCQKAGCGAVVLKSIFEANKNPQRIIELLSMIAGEKILPGEALVIFDEVQECPEALNTLKYFKEKANEYHVVAAGSLLGTLLEHIARVLRVDVHLQGAFVLVYYYL